MNVNGRGERIRTSDPLLPKQVRYQAALRPEPVLPARARLTSQPHMGRCPGKPRRRRLSESSRNPRPAEANTRLWRLLWSAIQARSPYSGE